MQLRIHADVLLPCQRQVAHLAALLGGRGIS
jgi:hypothetical protein